MAQFRFFGASVGLLLAMSSVLVGAARADDPTRSLGVFGDWQAVMSEGPQGPWCYVTATPDTTGAAKTGQQAALYVSHWPEDGIYAVPSVTLAHDIKNGTTPLMRTEKAFFRTKTLNGGREGSVVADADDRQQLIKEMQSGEALHVISTSSAGVQSEDVYSLNGFAAALAEINATCHGRRNGLSRYIPLACSGEYLSEHDSGKSTQSNSINLWVIIDQFDHVMYVKPTGEDAYSWDQTTGNPLLITRRNFTWWDERVFTGGYSGYSARYIDRQTSNFYFVDRFPFESRTGGYWEVSKGSCEIRQDIRSIPDLPRALEDLARPPGSPRF